MNTAGGHASGHVYRHEGQRGPVWRAKYRLPDGRRLHRMIGPVWTGRGRAPAGHFTKRMAETWLREVLEQARNGTLAAAVRTDVTVGDAADEFLRYVDEDRKRKASTIGDYRSTINVHIRPRLGSILIEDLTPERVDLWLRDLTGDRGQPLTNRSRAKARMVLHGVMERARKVWKLRANPVAEVEKPESAARPSIDVFTPREVQVLCRAAADDQDAAIYLTAAFTGLRRGELIALRWRDVDFAGHHIRVSSAYVVKVLASPKSGKVRAVPMAPGVADALKQLRERHDFTGDDDLVFIGELGDYLDASALRRRYKKALELAGLRPLRFHDLRHTFGTRMIGEADIVRVQEWMGHADIATTRKYLHFQPRADDALLVAKAFAVTD